MIQSYFCQMVAYMLFCLAITVSAESTSVTEITDTASLQTAVTEWCNDRDAAEITYGHISVWNTGGATDMMNLFKSYCSTTADFNEDISAWNVGSVTTMYAMFRDANSFDSDVSAWNVGSVTSMQNMFRGATSFNSYNRDISAWNVGSVVSMGSMFYGATQFNRNYGQDISAWNVGSVTNMAYMFNGATEFNQMLCWDVTSVLYINNMFDGTSGSIDTNYATCSGNPTASPTDSPSSSPTASPTDSPSSSPTASPTDSPSSSPTASPTDSPSSSPTASPTDSPSSSPTASPTDSPTNSPTASPTESPTDSPTDSPTESPTDSPTDSPTESPTNSMMPTPCADSTTYSFEGQPKRTCDWASKNPAKRCNRPIDFTFDVQANCPVTCGTCATIYPACHDSTTFYLGDKKHRNCRWVRGSPAKRCNKHVDSGNLVKESCPVACNTCPSFVGS